MARCAGRHLSHDRSRLVLSMSGRLCVARADGTRLRTVGRRAGTLARWSPDDGRLALVDHTGLFVFDLRSGRGRTIFEPPSTAATVDTEVSGYAWSPDGAFVAVSTEEEYNCAGDPTGPCAREAIWVVRVADGARRRLTSAPASDATAGTVLGWLPS